MRKGDVLNKKLAGFIIITAALISMTVWELWGREHISYEEILVVKEDLPANTVIDKKDIEIKRVSDPPKGALAPGEEEKVIGMESVHFMAEGSPVYKEAFRQSRFSTGGETKKEILSVPGEWLLSLPQTVRRGDEVTFFNGKVKLLTAVVAYVKDGSNNEVVSEDKDRLSGSSCAVHIEIIGNVDELVELSCLAGEGKRFTVLYC